MTGEIQPALTLAYMSLSRSQYGDDKGKVSGEIKFTGRSGSISLTLTESHCDKILDVVAEALVAQAQEAASNLTASVVSATNRLPAPN